MNKSPCLNCELRSLTCHSNCKEYLLYKAIQDSINQKRKEESDVRSYISINALNIRKKSNRKRY